MIPFERARLNQVELVPFERGIEEGAGAVMAAHVELPSLDAAATATFSRPILHDLLRRELRFEGLLYTDSMSMDAITKMLPPDEAAVRAVLAGADQVLHSPDPVAAFNGLKAAVASRRVSKVRLNDALDRTLRAKASLGLHQQRAVDLDGIPDKVGGRAHQAVALEASARSMTLVRDERHDVPLTVPRATPVLYLSVVDYPSGWLIAAPSRTFIPELRKRYPQVTSIEVSDRTALSELDLVRALVPRYGVVLASVFVRTTSGSGRLDLAPELVRLLRDIARSAGRTNTPFIATFFGNPYVAATVPEVPAVLLTYDLYDLAEASAVRAITGEARISGRLPIALPGMFPVGHGLDR